MAQMLEVKFHFPLTCFSGSTFYITGILLGARTQYLGVMSPTSGYIHGLRTPKEVEMDPPAINGDDNGLTPLYAFRCLGRK